MRVLLWAFATSASAFPRLWRRTPGLDIGIGIDIPLNDLQPGETYVYSTGYQFEITNGDFTTTILETFGPTKTVAPGLTSRTSTPNVPESPTLSPPAAPLIPTVTPPTATSIFTSGPNSISTTLPPIVSPSSQVFSLPSTAIITTSSETFPHTFSSSPGLSSGILQTSPSIGTPRNTGSESLRPTSDIASAIPSSSALDPSRISLSILPSEVSTTRAVSTTFSKSRILHSSMSDQNSQGLSSQSSSITSSLFPLPSAPVQTSSGVVDPSMPPRSSTTQSFQSMPFVTSQQPLFTSSAGTSTQSSRVLYSTATSLSQTSNIVSSGLSSSTFITSRTENPTTSIPLSTSSPQPPPAISSPSSQFQIQALTYSPYSNDGSCKTAQQVLADLEIIASKNIPRIRVYGTDCGSVQTIGAAVIHYGLVLDQGFYIDPTGVDSIDAGVQEFIQWASAGNWQRVYMILVGNESINNGFTNIDTLLSKIASVKSQLQASGYDGPISTAEPPNTFINNPSLCMSSALDFVGINAQPYFDQSTSASSAGTFVLSQISQTQSACGGKTVYITETGYPSAGDVNGDNVPSKPNQIIAIKAIEQATQGFATFFTMYNDLWKPPGPFNVEQSFGIIDII